MNFDVRDEQGKLWISEWESYCEEQAREMHHMVNSGRASMLKDVEALWEPQ